GVRGCHFVVTIVGVHEDVRARLQLGIDPAVALEQESAGSRAGHRGTRYTRALDQYPGVARAFDGTRDGRAALRGPAQMLRRALIRVQTAEAQPRPGV